MYYYVIVFFSFLFLEKFNSLLKLIHYICEIASYNWEMHIICEETEIFNEESRYQREKVEKKFDNLLIKIKLSSISMIFDSQSIAKLFFRFRPSTME